MDSIVDKGVIEDGVLLDYDFDDFLRCYTTKERTDSVYFRIRKSYNFMCKLLVNLWLVITWLLFDVEISLVLDPLYVFLIHFVGIGDFTIHDSLTWIVVLGKLEVFKASS